MNTKLLPALILALALVGCGGSQTRSESSNPPQAAAMPASGPAALLSEGSAISRLASSADQTQAYSLRETRPNNVQERMIVQTANISLETPNLVETIKRLEAEVKKIGGTIDSAERTGETGKAPTASYHFRVPVKEFDRFFNRVYELANVLTATRTSNDQTMEYVDLGAQIKNLSVQEQRIREMIGARTGKLSEVLQAETELARVRTSIDRLRSQQLLIEQTAAMSTVQISVQEIKKVEANQPAGLGTRSKIAWSESTANVKGFFEAIVLLAITLAPWMIVIVPVGFTGLAIAKKNASKQA